MLGMLTAQLLLIAVLAWKTLTPGQTEASVHDLAAAVTADKLIAALSVVEERRRMELAEERLKARSEFLDEAFRELKNTDEHAISRLQSRFDQTARLADDVEARDAQLREMQTQLNDARDKLLALEVSSKHSEERLASLNDSLRAENAKLAAAGQASSQPHRPEASARDTAGISSTWWWLAGVGLAVAALVVVGRHFIGRSPSSHHPLGT
jgi:hypothetical protein